MARGLNEHSYLNSKAELGSMFKFHFSKTRFVPQCFPTTLIFTGLCVTELTEHAPVATLAITF